MQTKLSLKQAILAALKASGAALIINAIIFYIFHAAGVISDSTYIQPNQPLTVVPVIMASIIPTIIAGLVFFMVEKYSNNGYKVFSIISIILLLLSFVSPFTQVPGISTGYALVLCAMHVAVVAALLYFIKAAKSPAGN